jgi:hypothetical protein
MLVWFGGIKQVLAHEDKSVVIYAFFTNSDFKAIAPNPSILQPML